LILYKSKLKVKTEDEDPTSPLSSSNASSNVKIDKYISKLSPKAQLGYLEMN
jgi:hypothetical protein